MARYKVLVQSYINDRIHEVGEEVEFDHDPGHNLGPIDSAAKKRKTDYIQSIGKRTAPGDPGFISDMMARNLTEGTAQGALGMIPAERGNSEFITAADSSAPNTD
jgi:hypothetical protein